MIKINLLPFRAAKKLENIRMQISVFILSVVLVVLILGFYFIKLNGTLKETQDTNAKLKKEKATYAQLLKEVDALEKKREDLKVKVGVIQALESKKAGPVRLFDEISIAVPSRRLFLKSMNESGENISMAGVAKDYDTVALFMTNLEKTKSIKSVSLGTTNHTEMEQQQVSTFTLSCVKDLPKEEPVGKAPSKKKKKKKKKRH